MTQSQELSAVSDAWLTYPEPSPTAPVRLFCLPYAGGGASLYRSWPALLPSVEVVAVELPGHETRLDEPPLDRVEPIVAALATAVTPHLDRPYAIFGHSFGALVGFELARELRRRDLPRPAALFASASPAPHVPRMPYPPMHLLSDRGLLGLIRQLRFVPPDVLDDPEETASLLPVMRADMNVVNSYEYADEPALACPVRVFGATADHTVREDDLYGWQAHTTSSFSLRMVGGEHLMVRYRAREITGWIREDLAGAGVPA